MKSPAEYSNTERWIITLTVMSAALMQVLDTTIVNVALPHMQGSLGATSDQITWTLTGYMVASGIIMPLTGYFSDRLGRKNYLFISILGFTLTSALCGAAGSLTSMVFFRLLQGMFGAALVPLSQAILADVYPKEEQGKAMAIWGVGIMAGPILGPTLGGYLTQMASWRWTFYINIPVGIMAMILTALVVPGNVKRERKMDWLGLFYLSLSIASLQYFLDRGDYRDWFNAWDIRIATALGFFGLIGFVVHNLFNSRHIVFNIRIFLDRNFTLASLLLAGVGLGLYGTMVIQPILLQHLLNYPVFTAGLVMIPRGISSMISMMLVGKIITRINPRTLIIAGVLICILGVKLTVYYSLNISPIWIIWPSVVQGFGLGLIFVPLSVIAFSTLPANLRMDATGVFSLLRTMGSTIGISICMTVYVRGIQKAWNLLSGFVNPYNVSMPFYLHKLHVSSFYSPKAVSVITLELARQAQMIAMVNAFSFIEWSFILMLPLVFLLRNPTHH
ncbi:MAG: multidrug MFS transporter [Gammaproteobacteria bacterium GWE2_42_36]|nr:MAG: multidrug MFS transporter [Gammaproteobacteria bacterium GWE2_42_36]HCU05564.1 MFS transporter [Coxiellaceae bacterium]